MCGMIRSVPRSWAASVRLWRAVVKTIEDLDSGVSDSRELLEMAVEEDDADTVAEVEAEIASLEAQLAKLEFRRMFSGEMDQNNALLGYSVGLWWY